MTTANRTADQFCVFRADDATWAVAALHVREVVDSVSIVPVPEAPPILVGVCHLRTEFLPVIGLRLLLGESSLGDCKPDFLLVLEGDEGPWAVPIQRALSLGPLEVAIRDTSGAWGIQTPGELGTATFRDEVARVIDPNRLYRQAAEALEACWFPATAAL